MAVRPETFRFTVDEYYRLAEVGILGRDDHVELIEGEIVQMNPIGSPHAACLNRLVDLLAGRVAGRAIVAAQNPIHLGEHSEPQPDLTLLRPRADFYGDAHPGAGDILLVVEISDTSAMYDRGIKVPLYAKAGICEAWIVDLGAGRLEVYRSPAVDRYQEVFNLAAGDEIAPAAFPDLVIKLTEILA